MRGAPAEERGVPPPRGGGRIEATFARLRARGEKALVAYLMAGDPDLATTRRRVLELVEGGADLVEIGVPFSDPIADGPVIQRAGQRALASGTTLEGVLGLVRSLRRRVTAPLLLMGYVNPFLVLGGERFARRARAAGVDGVILPDLPPGEGGEIDRALDRVGIPRILLLAPTSTEERLRTVARRGRGFLYYVSVTGVTGARTSLSSSIAPALRRIRRWTSLPAVVGFGISKPEHVRAVCRVADGAVVGSALVALLHDRPSAVPAFVRALKAATRSS